MGRSRIQMMMLKEPEETDGGAVLIRSEVPDADKWDLTALYTDLDAWRGDFAWIQRTYARIAEWKGRVGESAKTLAEVLEFDKQLDVTLERVYQFASLQLAEDGSNAEYLARMS